MFSYNLTDDKYKDFAKRTESDKLLKDEAFKIANNQNCDGYQRGLAAMVYKFLDKNSRGSDVAMFANKSMTNQLQRVNKLPKPIIRKLKKEEFIHHLKTIWGVDLADMELISKYNRRN